jgi:hypothetical protein
VNKNGPNGPESAGSSRNNPGRVPEQWKGAGSASRTAKDACAGEGIPHAQELPLTRRARSDDAATQTIVLVISPAPKAGRYLGYVGNDLIVTSRQPFLDGAGLCWRADTIRRHKHSYVPSFVTTTIGQSAGPTVKDSPRPRFAKFVPSGEVVVLDKDGVSDFDAPPLRKSNLARLLSRPLEGIFIRARNASGAASAGRSDQRKLPRPIIAAPTDQAHAILLAEEHHSKTVVFYLVNPSGPAGTLSALVGSEKACSIVPFI